MEKQKDYLIVIIIVEQEKRKSLRNALTHRFLSSRQLLRWYHGNKASVSREIFKHMGWSFAFENNPCKAMTSRHSDTLFREYHCDYQRHIRKMWKFHYFHNLFCAFTYLMTHCHHHKMGSEGLTRYLFSSSCRSVSAKISGLDFLLMIKASYEVHFTCLSTRKGHSETTRKIITNMHKIEVYVANVCNVACLTLL